MRSNGHSAEDERVPNRRSELKWDDEVTLLIERGRDREAAELASDRLAPPVDEAVQGDEPVHGYEASERQV